MKNLRRKLAHLENELNVGQQSLIFSVKYFMDTEKQEEEQKRILDEYMKKHPEDTNELAIMVINYSGEESHFIRKKSMHS